MMLQTAACRWCQFAVSLRHTQLRSGQVSHVSKRDIYTLFMLTPYEPTVRELVDFRALKIITFVLVRNADSCQSFGKKILLHFS